MNDGDTEEKQKSHAEHVVSKFELIINSSEW
jgi:hypothetical protein